MDYEWIVWAWELEEREKVLQWELTYMNVAAQRMIQHRGPCCNAVSGTMVLSEYGQRAHYTLIYAQNVNFHYFENVFSP